MISLDTIYGVQCVSLFFDFRLNLSVSNHSEYVDVLAA